MLEKDNDLAVRKRMLKRELEARRGSLEKKYNEALANRKALLKSVITHVEFTNASFFSSLSYPLAEEELLALTAAHRIATIGYVESTYPGGIKNLDKDSQQTLGVAKATALMNDFEKLCAECTQRNSLAREQAENRFVSDALDGVLLKVRDRLSYLQACLILWHA